MTQPYIDDGSYQLWATPGSSATTGSWFAIEMFSGQATTENAMRMQIGDRSIAVAHTSGGQTVAVARTPPGPIVTLTAFGWSVERLAQLAVTIDSDRGDVVFGDPALLGAHRLVTTRPLWIAMQGWPAEYIYYSPSWVDDGFSISIAETHTADDGGNGIDREAALRFGLDHATPFEVDGHSAVAGTPVGLYPQPMATWVDGDSIVTVSGALPIPRLISLARTVHRVEKTEWDGMQLQVKQSSSLDGPSFEVGVGNPVSFGTDANGDVWTVTVSANPFGGRWQIVWGPGSGWLSADAPTIATLVDTRRTYVLADLPRAVAATAELHVLRDGMEPVVVPFLDPDPTVDRTFAAYAFSEAVGYTAQIVAPDGAVLATWPSP